MLNQGLGYNVDRSEILHYWRNHELDFYIYVDCAVIPLPLDSQQFYNNDILDGFMKMPLPAYQFRGYVCLIDYYPHDSLIEKMIFAKEITYKDQILDFAYLDNINNLESKAHEGKFIYCFDSAEYDPIGVNDKNENLYKISDMYEHANAVNFNYQSFMFDTSQINAIIERYSLKGNDSITPMSTKEKLSYLKVINTLLYKNKLQDKAKHTLHTELNTFTQINNLNFVNKDTFAKIINELKENEDKLF